MLFALVFICTRLCQIVTLIPPVGMLSWFVGKFNDANVLTPDAILVLFIVTVLALAWCLFTLVAYSRSSHNALFVSFVDLCFLGALIAGIYFLRAIQWADCSDPSSSREVWYYRIHDVGIPGFRWSVDKPCAMLKASWAFAIMNTVFFAVTALAAFAHGDIMAAGTVIAGAIPGRGATIRGMTVGITYDEAFGLKGEAAPVVEEAPA
ncbi:hypothetical protein MKX07_004919 [Trichoderma sp. CBMAI-0711]|nr:hypothetical protein MKX07_004919 [Trichoderma sp. CBMAI-0711]